MDNEPLSSAEKKELRGIGQRLKPHVYVGKHGLSDTVAAEIETALVKNGLIKIRFDGDRAAVKSLSSEITQKLECEYVGGIGKTAVFFRDMPEVG